MKVKLVTTFGGLTLGLLNPKNPRTLLFKTRFGIHTFLLKQPIDIIVLDKRFKVVKLKESLKPNRVFFWNPKYFYAMELPRETIKRDKIILGGYINITLR